MFSNQNTTFVYRVAAAIIHDNRVLLHRAETDEFWTLPGGRCELMEPSIEAAQREMLEEMGEEVSVQRLLWIAEVFFAHDREQFHELDLIYLCTLPPGSNLAEKPRFFGDEEGLPLVFQWFDVNGLEQNDVYPVFLRQGLRQLPPHPLHIITRENYQF